MRSIGVFGEPTCKCVGVCVCMCLCGCERYSPGGTKLWKGGLGVLSIGTVPPRARWTDGMRYIVKPINKISAEKRKKPSRPCSGASSHPLSSRSVKNLSRTENEIKEKKRFIVLPKQESKPLDNTSCVYPNTKSHFHPNQSNIYHNEIRLLPKPTSGM